jgi:hypothetical protein
MKRKKDGRTLTVEEMLDWTRQLINLLKSPEVDDTILSRRSTRDHLFDCGAYFENLAMDLASRGERVALYERLACAFRRKSGLIDLGCLPSSFIYDALHPVGGIIEEEMANAAQACAA